MAHGAACRFVSARCVDRGLQIASKHYPLGILTTQVTNYLTYKTEDPTYRRFKWLVILVMALCLLKSVQNIYIIWETVVTNFANPSVAAILPFSYWWDYTTSFMVSLFL